MRSRTQKRIRRVQRMARMKIIHRQHHQRNFIQHAAIDHHNDARTSHCHRWMIVLIFDPR